jgi:hypothetical protein
MDQSVLFFHSNIMKMLIYFMFFNSLSFSKMVLPIDLSAARGTWPLLAPKKGKNLIRGSCTNV